MRAIGGRLTARAVQCAPVLTPSVLKSLRCSTMHSVCGLRNLFGAQCVTRRAWRGAVAAATVVGVAVSHQVKTARHRHQTGAVHHLRMDAARLHHDESGAPAIDA